MSESTEKERRDSAATVAAEDQATSEESSSPGGCPVEMHKGKLCDRPIYHMQSAYDQTPVCLMHSRDPGKSDAAFQEEFEAILKAAGNGIADFTAFVFPSANYEKREFKAPCVFSGARFAQDAYFYES